MGGSHKGHLPPYFLGARVYPLVIGCAKGTDVPSPCRPEGHALCPCRTSGESGTTMGRWGKWVTPCVHATPSAKLQYFSKIPELFLEP
jgi:hypothetical protein